MNKQERDRRRQELKASLQVLDEIEKQEEQAKQKATGILCNAHIDFLIGMTPEHGHGCTGTDDKPLRFAERCKRCMLLNHKRSMADFNEEWPDTLQVNVEIRYVET